MSTCMNFTDTLDVFRNYCYIVRNTYAIILHNLLTISLQPNSSSLTVYDSLNSDLNWSTPGSILIWSALIWCDWILSLFWSSARSGFPLIWCRDGLTENIFHFRIHGNVCWSPVSKETSPRNGLVIKNPSPLKSLCRLDPQQWAYTSQY
jgi:hypothetical protein